MDDLRVKVNIAENRLSIRFTASNAFEWAITRSPSQIWKLHVDLYLKAFSTMVFASDSHDLKPEVHWYRFLVAERKAISSAECDEFQRYLEWIISDDKLRLSDSFCEFAEVSAISFTGEKPIIEGYAKKRRGGRRFMLRGCSGPVGGVTSFFRPRFSKRWFALRDDFLLYTQDRNSSDVLDLIMFDPDFECELVPPSVGQVGTMKPRFLRSKSVKETHFLKVRNSYRKIILSFDSHARAVEWRNAIKQAHSNSEWNRRHRFGSFAPPRPGAVKFLVDGESYYSELVFALKSAQKEIYMTGWWLVSDLPLSRRPGESNNVLIELLKDRAEKGVKIFIIMYKELSMALSLDSMRTKRLLEAANQNIRVILHPRQFGARAVLAWSHHQKLVVVDHQTAFLGGLDVCLGRFDRNSHRLFDLDQSFPGQDYCNPCLRDCVDMTQISIDLMNRNSEPRLPWHDVHCKIQGDIVTDIVRHFVQLWNHVKTDKHKGDTNFAMLQTVRAPSESSLGGKLKRFIRKLKRKDQEVAVNDEIDEDDDYVENALVRGNGLSDDVTNATAGVLGRSMSMNVTDSVITQQTANSSYRLVSTPSLDNLRHVPQVVNQYASKIQFLRSGSWWSLGLPTDHSIMTAYLETIANAVRFIYIENQFFVTSAADHGLVMNQIGKAVAERILRAHSNSEDFRLYIVMPVMPAFENAKLLNPNGFVTRTTLDLQFHSLTRGRGSVLGFLENACGHDEARKIFDRHVVVTGLRQIDVWPDGIVRTEQLYVHSKLMIVDDEYAIIGSANINDRSMLGDRDSEIAIYVEDPRAVAGLRKQLWKEHFGIIEDGSETHAIKTLMDVNEIRSEVLRTLNDPCSDACFDLWVESSRSNAEIFRDVFGVVPCNELRTRKDFDARMELNQTRVVNIQTPEVVEQLGKLKGRLVAFQFTFLDQEENLSDPMPASASLCPREVFT